MGAVSLYLVDFVRDTYISDLNERLAHEASLLAETTSPLFRGSPDTTSIRTVSSRISEITSARVTIIARDGTVLADTWEDPAAMENHARRPEVQAALRGGTGQATRVSGTVRQELLYTAVPIRLDGSIVGVARVALPTSRVQANVNRIVATVALSGLVVTTMSVALAFFLAGRTSRSIRSVADSARRLAAGDLEHRVQALAPDETQELAEAFNKMAVSLRDMVRDLATERNKLSAVLETMADGVVVIDSDGQVVLMNNAAEALLGARQPHTTQPRRFMDMVQDYELQRLVSTCLKTRQRQHGEVELLRQRRFLSAIATPLADNGSTGVLLTLHDLTRMRQVETTRKEFVSNVSHELRSPLASMKAVVETLENGALEDPATARDFVQRVHRDIDRMTAMVTELLELSRLESGQVQLQPQPLELWPLVEEVLAQFQTASQAKDISLQATLPEGLPQVMAEEEKLRQVLVNLLDNAIKFTPGPGSITISATKKGRLVEVSVRDTGIGIPPEHLPHIFERFYKVDRARRDGGAGLGLAIVKHIVQAHGGEVRVESQEGAGSTFYFTVPTAP